MLDLPSTPDALPYLITEDNIALFERQRVYTRQELHSRYEIQLENYCKIISIEAHTMLDLANQEILPAVIEYAGKVASSAASRKAWLPDLPLPCEEKLVRKLSALTCAIQEKIDALRESVDSLNPSDDPLTQARHCRDSIVTNMEALRALVDEAEMIVDDRLWPFPGYGQLLTTK